MRNQLLDLSWTVRARSRLHPVSCKFKFPISVGGEVSVIQRKSLLIILNRNSFWLLAFLNMLIVRKHFGLSAHAFQNDSFKFIWVLLYVYFFCKKKKGVFLLICFFLRITQVFIKFNGSQLGKTKKSIPEMSLPLNL